MGTPETDAAVADRVEAFAAAIGMVPIRLRREQPGYVAELAADPTDVGALPSCSFATSPTPRRSTPPGGRRPAHRSDPFQIYDIVGLRTAYAIASADPRAAAWATYLKEHYLDRGLLGIESGEGFYRYR